ncbi:MAG: FmdE family protein [Candidatus Bathyarchaeia archaeon]
MKMVKASFRKRLWLLVLTALFLWSVMIHPRIYANPSGSDAKLGAIQIWDESATLKERVLNNLTFEAMIQYFGIGDSPIMYCVWRAAKVAIAILWPGEIPSRSDIRVITAHPTRGAADAIEFITRAKSNWELIVEAPPGTSGIVQTSANWVFTFIRKSTGQAVEIRVNETIFPERFHEIANSYRSKLASGETPTKEETAIYKAAQKAVKEAFKNLSDEELFVIRTFQYEAKPLDAEAFIGYYASPALPEFQKLKGVEAEAQALRLENSNLRSSNQALTTENESLKNQLSRAINLQYIFLGTTAILFIAIIALLFRVRRSKT